MQVEATIAEVSTSDAYAAAGVDIEAGSLLFHQLSYYAVLKSVLCEVFCVVMKCQNISLKLQ